MVLLLWQTHHLCDESLASYIFFLEKFHCVFLNYIYWGFWCFLKRYVIWNLLIKYLAGMYQNSFGKIVYNSKLKVIAVDQIIELLLPYCKCHCDRATNFKILSHRHLLASQLLPLFCCSEYDSPFSVPFLGCFCTIWASFDIWKKLKIELL